MRLYVVYIRKVLLLLIEGDYLVVSEREIIRKDFSGGNKVFKHLIYCNKVN